MRVLLVTGSFPPMPCGVGDYSALLAGTLAAAPGVSVAVLTSRDAAAHGGEGNVELFPVVERWNIFSLPKILQAVRNWQPDLVHLQFPTAGYGRVFLPNLLPLLLKLSGIPVVQTWHELPIYSFCLNALTRDTVITVEERFFSLVPWYYRPFLHGKELVHIPIASNIPCVRITEDERQELRAAYGCAGTERLVVYFGFAHRAKGVDALFRIADPVTDRLLLICALEPDNAYHREIAALMTSERWRGRSLTTGYLPVLEVARLLAAADAVLLPFEAGASSRNGSLLAAREQGTFVVSTRREFCGFDCGENTFYAKPGDEAGMRAALHAGSPLPPEGRERRRGGWDAIAAAHLAVYRDLLGRIGRERREEAVEEPNR